MNSFSDPDNLPLPNFMPYLEALDEEFQKHVQGMLEDAFCALSKAEKLMIRPLIEVYQLKKDLEKLQSMSKKSDDVLTQIKQLEKGVKSRLDVINENGDIAHLIKKFNVGLIDSHKKRSSKSLAKMGAEAILNFIDALKSTGELKN